MKMLSKRAILTLILLGCANGTMFSVPYLKYAFFGPMTQNMQTNGSMLGVLVSIYAAASVVLLLPGGVLTDRINPKSAILASLLLTAILAGVFSFTCTVWSMNVIIWLGLAVSTIFLAWPSLLKSVRFYAGDNAGTAYCVYYAASGLMSAGIAWLILNLYGFAIEIGISSVSAFQLAVNILSAVCLIFALLIAIFLETKTCPETGAPATVTKPYKLREIWSLIRCPEILLAAAILFATYALYIGISFLTPYFTVRFGLSDEASGGLTILRSFVFLAFAPLVGSIADRTFKSTLRLFSLSAPICAVSFFALAILDRTDAISLVEAIAISLPVAFLICGLYASMFSILPECRIPLSQAGMAIGFVSMISYTPDVLLQPLFGRFADSTDFSSIFLMLGGFATLCALFSMILFHRLGSEK